MGVNVHGSEFARLEYSADGGATWYFIPGVSGYNETGGEAPERDSPAFEGVAKQSGLPRVPSIEMAALYSPAHASWRQLRAAALASDVFLFRLSTRGKSIEWITGDDNKASIVAAELNEIAIEVPVAPTDANPARQLSRNLLSPGMVILLGDEPDDAAAIALAKYFVIDRIEGEGPISTGNIKLREVTPPRVAVAAMTPYSTWVPSLRRGPFAATIRIGGNAALENESDMTTSLTLAPRDQLPEWEYQPGKVFLPSV